MKIKEYLASGEIIDWENKHIQDKAKELSKGLNDSTDIAKACFIYVRDKIKHSNDYKLNPVTCKASDVLKFKTGFCYSKSHLLAALLRACKIPAGLCYQRLTIENDVPPFCLHGLNAVYLGETGWYRLDPRGNKDGVITEFSPPVEILAFQIITKGEADIPGIYPEPLPSVISALNKYKTYEELADNLPDIEVTVDF